MAKESDDLHRKTYHEQIYIDNTLRLRDILKTLPHLQKIIFEQ